MKTIDFATPITYGYPGGEGSTALPTAFIDVIARAFSFDTFVSKPARSNL
jgi:hypothetical protein